MKTSYQIQAQALSASDALMIPRILHQTSAKRLSWPERRLTSRAKSLMSAWQYLHWSDADIRALFLELLPNRILDFDSITKGIIKSDIGRCLILYQHGGVYFDTDYSFFQPPTDEMMSYKMLFGIEDTFGGSRLHFKLGNAFMASIEKHPFWLAFVHSVLDRLPTNIENAVHASGPMAISHFIDVNPQYLEDIRILPERAVYPPFRLGKLTTFRDEKTIGAHLCWGSWRDKGHLQQIRNRIRILGSALACTL